LLPEHRLARLRRVGIWAFVFFLFKGLLWLALPLLLIAGR
jgi:hypothetical protein